MYNNGVYFCEPYSHGVLYKRQRTNVLYKGQMSFIRDKHRTHNIVQDVTQSNLVLCHYHAIIFTPISSLSELIM